MNVFGSVLLTKREVKVEVEDECDVFCTVCDRLARPVANR